MNDMSDRAGIVYIAFGNRYRDEARRSIASLRRLAAWASYRVGVGERRS